MLTYRRNDDFLLDALQQANGARVLGELRKECYQLQI